MESADDSDFSGSDEDINESKTVTVSIVVPRTTTSDEVIENGKEKSHDTTKSVQQVTPTGLKESPKQEKKRLRLKDDLAISPDQTKIGKRQRKVNSLYSGYAIDKKTTQFFSQNASPTITETAVNPVQANKREIIMSPAEAQKRQKNLPKGYAYEPIFVANQAANNTSPTSETPSSSTTSTSSKRERKKKKENPEFVDPDEDSGEVSTTTSTIETPASKTRSKRSRGSASSTPISSNVEHIGDTSNQVQTITVHPIVQRKLDEDEDVVVEEEEDDDYLSESEEEFEEGTKKKRGYYRTKKQTLQMQLQELQSKLDLVTQNLAAAQNAAGTQSQSSSISSSGQKQNSKRRGSGTPAGRQKKKKEKDSFLDSDYEEDYDSEDSYSKKSRKKTSPSMRGNSSTSGGGRGPGRRKKEDIGVDVNKELGQCKRIIQALMKNQSAFPFNQPVDPVALGIMDYFDIIKNPMDLKTILDSLNAGEYENADDVAADVRLVWRNASTYNGPNHTVTKMAQVLSQLFEKKFKKIRPYGPLNTSSINDYSTNTTTTSISSSSTSKNSIKQHMQSTISELRDSMIQMREEIQALRKEKAAAATAAKQMARQSAPAVPGIPKQRGPGRPKTKNKPTPIHKSVTREDARPMTFEEKRILSENINLLDAEALGKVVQLIHQRMPNLAQNGNDEIEIDIDAMDAATLRHLEKFVKNSLNKLRKKGGSAPPTKIQAAEIVSQNTSKSIQDVKQRLQELSTRSTALKKKKIEEEGNEDVVIDDVQEENKNYPSVLIEPDSSSSSDSSSDSDSSSSSSSSSSDSDSSGPDKKKKKKDKLSDLNYADSSIPPPITVTIDKAPISEQKDNISLSPVRTETTTPTTNTTTTTTTTTTTAPNESETSTTVKKEEAPQILHPAAVSKEVELKNVDAWKFDLDAWDTQAVSSTTSPSSQTKDETWSQFQNRDLQNQLREKEREERERKEKEERELERKKQEEQRQREIAEAEENKKRAEQEENERKQKEIEARREAARKAREEMSAQRSVMDQSIMMQSFEMNHDTSDKPALLDVFKLKQDDLSSDRAPPREEGEV